MTGPAVPPQVPVSDSQPVIILGAVAAGGVALLGVIGTTEVPGWVKLTVAGVIAVALAVRGVLVTRNVTPWKDVAAKSDGEGGLVAGPAAPGRIVPGEVVSVVDDKPSPYSQPMADPLRPPVVPKDDGGFFN